MSSAYNVCFLYLSDVKHIISLRIHAVSIVTLIDAFTAFNPIWTHHEHFSSPNPYIGSWDTRHAKSGLHVVSRDVSPTSILAFHYILLYTWLHSLFSWDHAFQASIFKPFVPESSCFPSLHFQIIRFRSSLLALTRRLEGFLIRVSLWHRSKCFQDFRFRFPCTQRIGQSPGATQYTHYHQIFRGKKYLSYASRTCTG